MIIKSSIRGFSEELATHLGNGHDNETVRIMNISTSFSRFDKLDITPAGELKLILAQMDTHAAVHHKHNRHLLHVSVSPDEDMDDIQYERAWEVYEDEFGLKGRDFVEVEHIKEGRRHRHRVYYALDSKGRYFRASNNYVRNEKISRKLEFEFGHEPTAGRFNLAVHDWLLNRENEQETAEWMEDRGLLDRQRPVARETLQDMQISERNGLRRKDIKTFIETAYKTSDSQQAFEVALAEQNMFLARGDRESKRGRSGRYVIVDPHGVPVALSRCGINIKEFEERFPEIDYNQLPAVSAVQAHIAGKERQTGDQTERGDEGRGDRAGLQEVRDQARQQWQELKRRQQWRWTKLKAGRAEMEEMDRQIDNRVHSLWKDYSQEIKPLQELFDKRYKKKKERLKKNFSPRWRRLFRKHEQDIWRAKRDAINIPNKLFLLYSYRRDIRDYYGRENFRQYFQFWFSTKKQLDLIETRFEMDREFLFETYKRECFKLREKLWQKSRYKKKADKIRQQYLERSEELKQQKNVLREERVRAYTDLKEQDKRERQELSTSIREAIARQKRQQTLESGSRHRNKQEIFERMMRQSRGRDNENER